MITHTKISNISVIKKIKEGSVLLSKHASLMLFLISEKQYQLLLIRSLSNSHGLEKHLYNFNRLFSPAMIVLTFVFVFVYPLQGSPEVTFVVSPLLLPGV